MPTISQLLLAFVSWMPAGIGIIFIAIFALMVGLLVLKFIMWLLQLKFW